MQLINLNTWAGRIKEPLEAFLKARAEDTDIFCFQEIFNKFEEGDTSQYIEEADGNTNLFQEMRDILVDFDAHFCPVSENVYGIAIFLKKGIGVVASGEVLLYTNPNLGTDDATSDHDRKMQWIHIKKERKDVIIMNVHGHWDAAGKGDTPNRIAQSKAINTFIESTGSIPKILVGDFNLAPNTESIALIEKYVINLVKQDGIETTRTELYTGADKHTDYVFVSSEVLVEKFAVLPDVVSDHSPLFIQFDVF